MARCRHRGCQFTALHHDPGKLCSSHRRAAERVQTCVAPGCEDLTEVGKLYCADHAENFKPWRRPPKGAAARATKPRTPPPPMPTCAEEGCGKVLSKRTGKGYCRRHAARHRAPRPMEIRAAARRAEESEAA